MSSGSIIPKHVYSVDSQHILWESAWLCLADLCDAFDDDEKRSVALESARRHNPDKYVVFFWSYRFSVLTLHHIAKVNFKCGRYELAGRMFHYIAEKNPHDGSLLFLCHLY